MSSPGENMISEFGGDVADLFGNRVLVSSACANPAYKGVGPERVWVCFPPGDNKHILHPSTDSQMKVDPACLKTVYHQKNTALGDSREIVDLHKVPTVSYKPGDHVVFMGQNAEVIAGELAGSSRIRIAVKNNKALGLTHAAADAIFIFETHPAFISS